MALIIDGIDYYPFIIGALFGFGAGWLLCYFMFRIPKIRGARKAVKMRKLNQIKKYIQKRNPNSTDAKLTVGSAIICLKRYQPEMFNGVTDEDLLKLASDLGLEDAEKILKRGTL